MTPSEEQLEVHTQRVETGKVRVIKLVEMHDEVAEVALERQEITIERVAVNKFVNVAPAVRYEGDVMIVSLLEEVLVVENDRAYHCRICGINREIMANRQRKSGSTERGKPGSAADTLVANQMLGKAVEAVHAAVKVDRQHDVPYLGGCSRDGKTVYLDRNVPRSFTSKGRRINAEPFLVLHEAVERSLLMHLGLRYQFAHQIALRAEQAAVRAAGISWHDYNSFTQKYAKQADDETIRRPPVDLDLDPYRDESDPQKLKTIEKTVRRNKVARRAQR